MHANENSPQFFFLLCRSNSTLRDACYIHPLCQWSWFNESCECVDNPCATEFCLVENTTHCHCSTNVCKGYSFLFCKINDQLDRCVCSNDIQYNKHLELQQYERKRHDDKGKFFKKFLVSVYFLTYWIFKETERKTIYRHVLLNNI